MTGAEMRSGVARNGDIELFYRDCGSGVPIVWSHEYFGDHRSWAPQLSAFGRDYRQIVYSARGYPGSSAPDDPEAYSQQLMIDDLGALLDDLGIERAVIAGLSMGANIAINYGIQHPERCLGLVVAGCGSGSTDRAGYEQKAAELIERITGQGMAAVHRWMEGDPTRLPLKEKDPAGWEDFGERLAEHAPHAAAHIYRGVQLKRRGILSLGDELAATSVPALIVFGDQDSACVDPGLYLWRELPEASLAVLPATGHCVNLEEPELFNAVMGEFLDSLSRAGRLG